MLFSIIIPTYNRAGIIEETLRSVLSQTFSDYEIIVVDDGSTDNTKETVDAIKSEKIVYYYKKNEERSIARNFGAEKANGRYLIFLDSDDKMRHDHLFLAHQFLAEKKFIPTFIFAGYIIFNTDGSTLYEFSGTALFKKKKLFYGNFLGCSSIIIEKDLFKKHLFDTDRKLILFEDWELWLRVIAETPLHCINSKSILMINHEGRSVLNYNVRQLIDKILFFKNHILHSAKIISGSITNRQIFLMGIYSYASLHIALTKRNKLIAIQYLFKSIVNNPAILFKRRFLGIIKQLF